MSGGPARPNIALIIGCARSGTSILGELIAAHPAVKYIYEAHEVWEWGGMGPNGSHRLTEAAATPEVSRRIRRWFGEQRDEAGVLVEKCPRNALRVPYIHRIFPEARLIHIVRDGRDVTCSLRPGIGGETWRHHKPENWLRLSRLDWAQRCALTWKSVVELAHQDLSSLDHLEVRYEDLVMAPEQTSQVLLNYLQLEPDRQVVAFLRNIQDETRNSYLPNDFSRRWFRNDHGRRVGRWRENLTPEEVARVEALIGPSLERFGYPLSSMA